MTIADAAGYFDAATPGYLVEIKRLIAVEPTQMHRIFAGGCQGFEMRAGDLHHIGLRLRQETELQQFRSQLIAFARQEGEESPFHHRIGEAVGGRSGETHPFGQVGELYRPVDHLVEQVQPTLQGLRPGGFRLFLSFTRFWI